MIAVKLDTPDQEFYVKRCLQSIRQFYPTTLVVLVKAAGTDLTIEPDAYTRIEQNPYYAVFGSMYLFYTRHYAEYAYILHDSMVVLHPLPEPFGGVRFIYSFGSVHFYYQEYTAAYERILTAEDVLDIKQNLPLGCLGAACLIRHDAIQQMGLLDLIPKISDKHMFEAMERVLPYLTFKHGLNTTPPTICGDAFNTNANPWTHGFHTAPLEQIHGISQPILKTLAARL